MSPVAAIIAGVATAFHLATANVWGRHRDEFYYLACGRRLAWGFVDHPPLTPALYRLADVTVGSGQLALRVVPALMHGLTILLAARLGQELGGNARAQVVTALAIALAPIMLTTSHFLGTVTPELTLGTGLALLVVHLVQGGDPRWWLVVGLVTGLGLLNKWTFAFAVAGLAVGLLVGNRDALATPWLAGGALVAAALVAPNVVWQADHGWPQLEFAATLRDYGQTPAVVPAQLLLLGAAAVLAVPAVHWLAVDQPRFRFLLVGFGVALGATLLTGGKPYYTAALLVPLVAAGAVAMQTAGAWLVPTVAVAGVLLAPLATPLTPRPSAEALRRVNPELGEMIGWEELADQVRALQRRHPSAGVVTRNYSEAGAIELLAPDVRPPASGHNSYWDWGPPAGDPDEVLVLGLDRPFLLRSFARVERVATVRTPDGVHNLEDGTPVWLAAGPRAPWTELWSRFRRV
jgi:hypothetical protein